MKALKDPTTRGSSKPTRYESLARFYRADSRRLSSREQDIGLWWRADADGPLHRAAWVSDTGELYIVRLGPPDQGGGHVEVLGIVGDRAGLEELLEGWRERWLRARLLRFAPVRPGALAPQGL